MKHDAAQAIAFLRLLRPGGPHHLVRINPETRKTHGFRLDEGDGAEAKLAAWLDANAQWNIYYHVNPLRRDPEHGKATKPDVARMAYLHVDVDPRAREDLAAEKVRIERALSDPSDKQLPPPTGVVDSGGGCNAVWLLAESVEIEGDADNDRVASCEAAERYNQQIERLFEGDHCHNVDRILRVPGTVNWPDEGKRKKNRVPTVAKLLSWEAHRVYPISRFIAAPVQQSAGLGVTSADEIKVSGDVARLRSLDELPDGVAQQTRELILHGEFPGKPGHFKSDSEASHHCLCELERAGCSVELMFSIITDERFLISRHVRKKRSGMEKYAMRQIRRAKDACVDPKLDKMNQRHAVVRNFGGRCRIIEVVEDPVLKRKHLTKQTVEDIRNSYMHIKVEVGKTEEGKVIKRGLGAWWLDHERRMQYDRVVFAPGRDVPGAYNLWQGFAFEALPGNKHERFLEHVRTNVCAGDETHYKYLVSWMARAVQQPDEPGHVAVVLRGEEGIGKSFFANHFGAIWGQHYLPVTDAKHLTGSFNAHLRDCVLLFADEAFHAQDKAGEERIKTLLTERTNTIEAKGVDMEIAPNFVHLIMASNKRWVVPTGPHSRRYFVLDVLNDRRVDTEYFKAIATDLADGGYEHLLHYLMQLQIRGWNPLPVPRTGGLIEQRLLSLSSEEEWWYRKLGDGVLMPQVDWDKPVVKQELLDDYYEYMKALGWGKRATATALLQFLHRALPSGWPRPCRITRRRVGESREPIADVLPALHFPPIEECRAHWDRHFGAPGAWLSDDEVTTHPVEEISSDNSPF